MKRKIPLALAVSAIIAISSQSFAEETDPSKKENDVTQKVRVGEINGLRFINPKGLSPTLRQTPIRTWRCFLRAGG